MFGKVIFGLALIAVCFAEDGQQSKDNAIKFPGQGYVVEQSYNGYLVPATAEQDYYSPIPVASGIVGIKETAIALASKTFFWVLAHFWAIALGFFATFAFCKVTTVCDLSYKHIPEMEQFRSLITPSALTSASEFVHKAIDKFAKEQVSSKSGNDL